jgi:putative endonuclease
MIYVYIVKCADETYYTGYTTDITRRLDQHNRGKGAKYTRGRYPVSLCYLETLPDKSCALRREEEIKRMSRKQKQKLIDTYCSSKSGSSIISQ